MVEVERALDVSISDQRSLWRVHFFVLWNESTLVMLDYSKQLVIHFLVFG